MFGRVCLVGMPNGAQQCMVPGGAQWCVIVPAFFQCPMLPSRDAQLCMMPGLVVPGRDAWCLVVSAAHCLVVPIGAR